MITRIVDSRISVDRLWWPTTRSITDIDQQRRDDGQHRHRQRCDADVLHQAALGSRPAASPSPARTAGRSPSVRAGAAPGSPRPTRAVTAAAGRPRWRRCPVERGSRIQTMLRLASDPTSTPAVPSANSSTTGDTCRCQPLRSAGAAGAIRAGSPWPSGPGRAATSPATAATAPCRRHPCGIRCGRARTRGGAPPPATASSRISEGFRIRRGCR